jgi:hypothetical protein
MNGDRTIVSEPELGMEREAGVTGFGVPSHDQVRVRRTCYFLYDDVIAFEHGVSFVCW